MNEASQNPSYFLISVSTRENLELCIRYALAGFPGTENGAWTFCEIAEGDFVSFLYGAKAYNLYRAVAREAIAQPEGVPPWKQPLRFSQRGRTYWFPFRVRLRPIRIFAESLVRAEFAYVAENLLLRGGYRKTHFQADQTTLQSVSEMGARVDADPEPIALPPHSTFIPRFSRARDAVRSPEVCRFRETILQCAIRRYLMRADHLRSLLSLMGTDSNSLGPMEALSEKALPQGHIDLLLKQRIPIGSALKIPIEVKTNRAGSDDLAQIRRYITELRGDCHTGALIASDFRRNLKKGASDPNVHLIRYRLSSDLKEPATFDEIVSGMRLESI